MTTSIATPAGVSRSAAVWLVLFPVVVLTLLRMRGMYQFRLQPSMLDGVRILLGATSLAAISILSVRVLVTDDPTAAGQTVRHWLLASFALAVGHVALTASEVRARKSGAGARPTLIIGAGRIGRRAAKRLLDAPELGLRPVGFLDKNPLPSSNGAASIPVLGASWDLDRVVAEHEIEHAVIAFSSAPHEVLVRVARRCDELGLSVSFIPRLYERMKESVTVEHLGGLPLISVEPTDPMSWQFGVKHVLDRITAAVLLLLLAPLLLAIAIAVWVSVGRPVLYRQRRAGRDVREFEMLKFRTMKLAPIDTALLPELPPDIAPGGIEGEDRRTKVGRFLRRTALDELPQLVNVLRGEMSIVGPRPERPDFVRIFERDVHRYGDRHRVKSGITGWAQVNGLRGKTSLADRVEWDNYYVDNWSLWLDFKIVASTALALIRFPAE